MREPGGWRHSYRSDWRSLFRTGQCVENGRVGPAKDCRRSPRHRIHVKEKIPGSGGCDPFDGWEDARSRADRGRPALTPERWPERQLTNVGGATAPFLG